MTFCLIIKLNGQATAINNGIARGEKRGAAVRRRPLWGTATVTSRGGAALAMIYSRSSGVRFNSPPLVGADETSQESALLRVAQQNKGLHRTAHKLPRPRGLAMINPVEAAHYCARALFGEP